MISLRAKFINNEYGGIVTRNAGIEHLSASNKSATEVCLLIQIRKLFISIGVVINVGDIYTFTRLKLNEKWRIKFNDDGTHLRS
jgi:hypothetical protein